MLSQILDIEFLLMTARRNKCHILLMKVTLKVSGQVTVNFGDVSDMNHR